MKKILLLLVLIDLSAMAICQNYFKSHSNTRGVWNYYIKKYEWEQKRYVDMDVTIKGKIILISDNAGSFYVIGDAIDDITNDTYQRKQLGWYATDEKKRTCVAKLVFPKTNGELTGECELYIMYDDFAFAYDISPD